MSAPAASAVIRDTAEPPARFSDLLAAEWIKLRSLRSTPWAVAVAVVFVAAAGLISAAGDHRTGHADNDRWLALSDSYPIAAWMTMMLAAGGAGAIAVVSEYGSGLIRPTTIAVPARAAVLLAKAAVVTALGTAAGAVASAASYGAAQALLAGRGYAFGPTEPAVLKAMVASALLAPVCALVGLGVGTLIRHGATTTGITMFALLLLPNLFSNHRPGTARFNHMTVLGAWQRLVETWGAPSALSGEYASLSAAWAVYAAWPLAALALAVVAIRRRDV